MSELVNKLTDFVEKIKELMFEKHISPKELAKELGIDYSTVMRYFRGETIPTYRNFIKMLYYFDCTADYLLCLENYNSKRKTKIAPPFCKRLKDMMEKHHMSQYRLHHLTNYSYHNFNMWLNGKASPYLDNIIKLAEVFNCTVEYLIFGEE